VQKLAVYGKQGKACPNCSCNLANGGIKKIEQSGRSSFYCEKKQV
jgi:formamidopyrimidine-DNA glycosylase